MFSQNDYAQVFKSLLPRGKLFSYDKGTNIDKFALGVGQMFSDFSSKIDVFLGEIFPNTSVLLFNNWLTDYGFPDDCSSVDDPISVQRLLLLLKYNRIGGQTPEYYIWLAAYLGFTITITTFSSFRTNINKTNDILYGDDWQWVWKVNLPSVNGVTFKTNLNTTNEQLIYFNNQRLICMIERTAPAHTEVIFDFME